MARPMLLIKKELLNELHTQAEMGVPICKLIKQHDLNITPPTLTKLLKYMKMCTSAASKEVHNLIYFSLFPDWLAEAEEPLATQAPSWRYRGSFPLGTWEKIDDPLNTGVPTKR